jgi:hypothetical protein
MVTLDLARGTHMSSADRIPPNRLGRQTQGRDKRNWLSRINNQKTLARQRGEEISDEEARRREVAKLHRPKLKVRLYNPDRYGPLYNPRLYDGAEVVQGRERVPLPNCVALEPSAVHSKRDYDKITTEVARMIAEGNAHPEEIRLLCSAFFILRRSGEDWLVRFGERRYPYKINEGRLRVNYTGGTVALDESLTIKVKSVGIFDHYFDLYTKLEKHRP